MLSAIAVCLMHNNFAWEPGSAILAPCPGPYLCDDLLQSSTPALSLMQADATVLVGLAEKSWKESWSTKHRPDLFTAVKEVAGLNSTSVEVAGSDSGSDLVIVGFIAAVVVIASAGLVYMLFEAESLDRPAQPRGQMHGRRKALGFQGLPAAGLLEGEGDEARTDRRGQAPPTLQTAEPGKGAGKPLRGIPDSFHGRSSGSASPIGHNASFQPAARRSSKGTGGVSDQDSGVESEILRHGDGPPHMCGALVLPHCEAWFAVGWSSLHGANNFELFGLSGRPLLRAEIMREPGMHEVKVAMLPAISPTLGRATMSGRPGDVFTVSGSTSKVYGTVTTVGQGIFTLIHSDSGREVFTLTYMADDGHILVLAPDGTMISAACRCEKSSISEGLDHLEVRVYPGFDAVLALCCILGLVCFGNVVLAPGSSLGLPPEGGR